MEQNIFTRHNNDRGKEDRDSRDKEFTSFIMKKHTHES